MPRTGFQNQYCRPWAASKQFWWKSHQNWLANCDHHCFFINFCGSLCDFLYALWINWGFNSFKATRSTDVFLRRKAAVNGWSAILTKMPETLKTKELWNKIYTQSAIKKRIIGWQQSLSALLAFYKVKWNTVFAKYVNYGFYNWNVRMPILCRHMLAMFSLEQHFITCLKNQTLALLRHGYLISHNTTTKAI